MKPKRMAMATRKLAKAKPMKMAMRGARATVKKAGRTSQMGRRTY